MYFIKVLNQSLKVINGGGASFFRGVVVCMCAGVAELIGLSALFPFLTLLTRPELIESNYYIHKTYEAFAFESERVFLVLVGFSTLISVLAANLLMFYKSAYIAKFSISRMRLLSEKIYDVYIKKSITDLNDGKTGEIARDIIDQTDAITNTVLISLMTVFSEGFVLAIAISIAVFFDPFLSLLIIGLIAIVMWSLLAYTKKEISHYGFVCDSINAERYSFVLSTFHAVKEIKVLSKEKAFVKRFGKVAGKMSEALTRLTVIQLMPNFFMQTITGIAVISAAIIFLIKGDDLVAIVPNLAFVAAVGLRLMPSMSKIANSMNNIRQNHGIVQNMYNLVSRAAPEIKNDHKIETSEVVPVVNFKNVDFFYKANSGRTIKNASFIIPEKKITAIVGASGAGKSTLVDLTLGLLKPNSGEIYIGDFMVSEFSREDLSHIFSYVHQSIYISDTNFVENIAFGIDNSDVDAEALNRAIKLSHLESVIASKRNGLYSRVGERGSLLSGGQKQRLGIARALYTYPKILILDESTNALDGNLESEILSTLRELKKDISIVMVAHSKEVIKKSDWIVMVDNGEIVATGDQEKLFESNMLFREFMAE